MEPYAAFGAGEKPSRSSACGMPFSLAWRAEDTERCILANARALWTRHAEDSRVALEEHAEYIRSMATLSAFMAGFVNIAFIQFDFTAAEIPYNVLLGFGVTNALTTAVNTCCMAICTFMLGSTFRTFTSMLSEEEEAIFMTRCRAFAKNHVPGSKPPAPPRNFRTHWDFFCRAEWHRAMCLFTSGIIFFIVNTAFAAFIKFNTFWTAAIVLSLALAPGFLLCLHLHLTWMPFLFSNVTAKPVVEDQERPEQDLRLPWAWCLPGVKVPKGTEEKDCRPELPKQAVSPQKQWQLTPQWRTDLLKQRALDDCCYLWHRYVRKTRSEVEERVEQLRSFSFLSGTLAGFAVAALLQLEIDTKQTRKSFQTWFAVTAGLCAGCSTAAMAMCSLILISIVKMSRGLVSEEEEAIYLSKCLHFASSYVLGSRPPMPARSFSLHWDTRCESEWNRAFFLFALGLSMFVANILAGVWIKYNPYRSVSIASTACMALALGYLSLLYFRWIPYLTGSTKPIRHKAVFMPQVDVLPLGFPWDFHLPPRPLPTNKPSHHSRFSLLPPSLARLSQKLGIGNATPSSPEG